MCARNNLPLLAGLWPKLIGYRSVTVRDMLATPVGSEIALAGPSSANDVLCGVVTLLVVVAIRIVGEVFVKMVAVRNDGRIVCLVVRMRFMLMIEVLMIIMPVVMEMIVMCMVIVRSYRR